MSKIKDKLKDALSQSCTDAFYFSDDETRLIDAEYLLTVNAAKSIQSLNICFGSPYKILLEHSTKKFSTNCPPLLAKVKIHTSKLPKSICRLGEFDTSRPGKIDIAIYENKSSLDIPMCAIEVKGFNPSKSNVLDDLIRNLEYFNFNANTGLSQISSTFFIALHSYKNTMSDNKEKSNLNRITNRYKKYIGTINFPKGLLYEIDVFTVRRGVLPDEHDPNVEMFGLDGTEDYHFMGVIIKFSK